MLPHVEEFPPPIGEANSSAIALFAECAQARSGESTIRNVTWSRYVDAAVRISSPLGELVVRPDRAIGGSTGDYPDTQGRTVHIIPAFEPDGSLPVGEDAEPAHERLQQAANATGAEVWDAVVGDQDLSHAVPGVAVIGLDDEQA